MAYSSEISRSNPTVFLFLVDQSGSMQDKMAIGPSKCQFVADVLNRTLQTLVTRCQKSDGIRDYFQVGVIGYGDNNVYNGFQAELASSILNPISKLETSPLRVEDRKKKVDDGAGGLIEQPVKFPVWFDPKGAGGTPMRQGLTKAAEEIVAWCDAHPNSYPPTVLHVTDGESTDGDPEELANHLRQVQTSDGQVVLLNLHVSAAESQSISFPSSEAALPNNFAKMLFRMSSQMPPHLIKFAQEKGHQVSHESRGFVFNGEASEIVDFFDIGTRAAQLR